MRVIIYKRVSTDDQEDNTSLEQQELDCLAYCDEHGYVVVAIFEDVYTGSVWREREGFMAARAMYLSGQADMMIVRTYSRFTRMIADYFILTQEMREHNVKLRRHKKKEGIYLIYRCPGLARAARTCEHIEISAPKIDTIV